MTFSFHPAAEEELLHAVNYYDELQNDLGLQFAHEVYEAIQNIIAYPDAWPPLSDNTRRCLIHRFPYGVIYQQTQEEIVIIAVMQLSKKPDYWESRA